MKISRRAECGSGVRARLRVQEEAVVTVSWQSVKCIVCCPKKPSPARPAGSQACVKSFVNPLRSSVQRDASVAGKQDAVYVDFAGLIIFLVFGKSNFSIYEANIAIKH